MVGLLMRAPWISLPSLTLGRAVVPELTQEAATGERLGREALRLLDPRGALDTQRAAFSELQGQLGAPGVGARAARLVLAEAGLASCACSPVSPARWRRRSPRPSCECSGRRSA